MSGKYTVVIRNTLEPEVFVSVLSVILVSTHWELNLTTYYLETKKYVP